MQKNLANWERLLSIAAGVGVIVAAPRRGAGRMGGVIAGASLIARGTSGHCPVSAAFGRRSRRDDTREALAGARGTKLKESVTIARTADEIFAFWNESENLPRFIRGLERIERLGPALSRWTLRGPAGVRLQWQAEIINRIEPELIAWRSLPGADVVSAGSVHFKPAPGGGTEVTVSMQYDPPGGKVGTAAGWLIGRAPAADLREDLRRLKRLLEAGEEPTVAGQPAGPRTGLFRAARWVAQ